MTNIKGNHERRAPRPSSSKRNSSVKPAPAEKKPAAPVASEKLSPADIARRETFSANLPCFRAVVRGNVVADGETFTSKAGETYYTFRIANTRMRHGDKSTMFIKVIMPEDNDFAGVVKGNYVEVSGDYSDDGVTPGTNGYGPSVFRTLFVGPDDSVKVLIG